LDLSENTAVTDRRYNENVVFAEVANRQFNGVRSRLKTGGGPGFGFDIDFPASQINLSVVAVGGPIMNSELSGTLKF
jgi:hypothetical protein